MSAGNIRYPSPANLTREGGSGGALGRAAAAALASPGQSYLVHTHTKTTVQWLTLLCYWALT